MTVYNMSKMAAGIQPRILPGGYGLAVISSIALAVALALNDTLNVMQLAAMPDNPNGLGPTILGGALDCDRLDSNGAPTLKFDLGDATVAGRYIAASTVAQPVGGGVIGFNVGGSIGYQPFAASFGAYPTLSNQLYTLVLKVNTGPATWVNGSIRVKCEFTYDP